MKEVNPLIDKNKSVISIRGLKKAFDEFEVLRGVDLDLYQGENLVVLGRSGTGKSVLIKIISGLLTLDEGVVQVLGHHVDKIKPKELDALRLKLGFSFQNSALYDSMTIRENLEFPLVRNQKDLSRSEIDALLGFSWGFEKREGEVALLGPSPLAPADWDRHHGYLREAFPRWSFVPGFSGGAAER